MACEEKNVRVNGSQLRSNVGNQVLLLGKGIQVLLFIAIFMLLFTLTFTFTLTFSFSDFTFSFTLSWWIYLIILNLIHIHNHFIVNFILIFNFINIAE